MKLTMNYSFLSAEHETRFRQLRQQMSSDYFRNNKEYLSVAFLMAGNEELHRKVSPYFDTTEGGLDSEEMFKNEDFSSGLKTLAKLAVNLFNNNESVTPLDLIGYLDDPLLELAINAILFRRYGISSGYDTQEEQIFS